VDTAQLGALMEELGRAATEAASVLALATSTQKDAALRAAAAAVRAQAAQILAANERDLAAARARRLSAPRLERLRLEMRGIEAIAASCETLAAMADPVGRVSAEWQRPNGLKIHKDGRIFIADYKRGLMLLDAKSGRIEPLVETAFSEGFKGLNDLHFADNGDLYFTDQGQTGIADPSGRVYRLRRNGELQRLIDNAPSPNGITLNNRNTQVYVAITRAQQIWRLPLMAHGTPSKTGVAIQLSGGHAGPDGIEMDEEDGLVVCHLGVGIWRFNSNCLPTHLVHPGTHHRLMSNIAFGGPDRRTLFITDSLNGEILTAEMPVAGKKLYAHR